MGETIFFSVVYPVEQEVVNIFIATSRVDNSSVLSQICSSSLLAALQILYYLALVMSQGVFTERLSHRSAASVSSELAALQILCYLALVLSPGAPVSETGMMNSF